MYELTSTYGAGDIMLLVTMVGVLILVFIGGIGYFRRP